MSDSRTRGQIFKPNRYSPISLRILSPVFLSDGPKVDGHYDPISLLFTNDSSVKRVPRTGRARAFDFLYSRRAGRITMNMPEDIVGAFVPGPRLERAALGSGRLSGLTFAVKD